MFEQCHVLSPCCPLQGRQRTSDIGGPSPFLPPPFSSLPLPPLLPFPLIQLGGLGSAVSSPTGSGQNCEIQYNYDDTNHTINYVGENSALYA